MSAVRTLSLDEMVRQQKGTFARRLIQAVMSVALRLFFRRIETSDVGRVPATGPLIFVLNHPNGLIDPGLVFCALPRRVSFLAKSTLFRLPVLKHVLRIVEALPLYRRLDAGEDLKENQRTFLVCHDLLRRGRCIALFPEGLSHRSTQLRPIKSGAARIALGALSVEDGEPFPSLQIVPVGLYYTSKTPFRGEVLLRFGEPFEVKPVDLEADGEVPRGEVRRLTQQIEAALKEVTLNVEDEDELEGIRKAEQLFSSLYHAIDLRRTLVSELEFLRRFARARRAERQRAPESVDALEARIRRYEEGLRRLGLTPEALSVASHTRPYIWRHFTLQGLALLLLTPVALIGVVVHLPAYLVADLLARRFRRHGPDESGATAKILIAIVVMPLTWIAVTVAVFFASGWRTAAAALPAVVACGYIGLRWAEEAYAMRAWFKAALLLVRRRGRFLRLLLERRELHEAIGAVDDELTPSS
jgi:1-acyl-sn-glycerol-3-phosphate acyltransferase